MKKRFVPAVLVSCVLAGNGVGQVETAAQLFATTRTAIEWNVVAMLRSGKQETIAWGGFLAAQLQLTACIPELRKALARSPGGERVPVALLDALIQTDAIVPADELAPFLRFGEPTIVLLSRRPDANRALLLRVFHHKLGCMYDERRACGNLLANLRDAAFVRELLSTPIVLWVDVADPGAKVEAAIPLGGGCISCGRPEEREGFPPMARYLFGSGPGAGGLSVAPGPMSVFAQRSSYHGGLHCSSSEGYFDFHAARIRWFEQLLGPEQLDLIQAIDQPLVFEWKDRATLDARAEQARRDTEKSWRALVAACVAAKLLTVDPATEPLPSVTFFYMDDRTDKSVALPANPEWWK